MHQVTALNKNYFPGIDGLRALAVIAVILYHVNPQLLPGGFSGVDVFFVISGYVVSSSLAQSDSSCLRNFVINFYAKRIIRILPALLTCLLVVSIVSTLFIPFSWLSESIGKTGVAAFFGASNILLALFGDGYFSPREEFNPFVHTWSLGLEEQFYIVFPGIVYVWLRSEKLQNKRLNSADLLLPCLLAASFLYSIMMTFKNQSAAYYLLPSRFWELSSGALLYRLHRSKKLIPRDSCESNACLFAGLLLVTAGFIFSSKRFFPFPCALLPVIGTALMISSVIAGADSKNSVGRFIGSKFLTDIGKISYSLYLWHWPVLVVFKWTLGLENNLLETGAALFITALLSIASYRYIESPLRRATSVRQMPKGRIIYVGLSLTGLTTLLAMTVFLNHSNLSLSVTGDKKVWYPSDPAADDSLKAVPGKILKAVSGRSDNRIVMANAHTTAHKTQSGKKLFVLGDSHAITYITMFGMLSAEHDIEVYLYARGGCSAANLLTPTMGADTACGQYFKQSLNEIYTLARPGDIVFIASLRMNRLCNQWETIDPAVINELQCGKVALENKELALREASGLLESLEEKSLHVIIDAPKPVFKAPLYRCSDWFNATNPICSAGFTIPRDDMLHHRKPVMESLQLLQKSHPRLVIWDPMPILCPAETCAAFDQAGPLFFDGDHLTAHGNRVLYPSFALLLQDIWTSGSQANL